MATPAQALADIAAKVESATGATRLDNDYTDEFNDVGRGSTVYQLQGFPNGTAGIDANLKITLLSVTIAITRVLPSGGSERSFTEGAMQTYLATLADRTWWESIASVHALTSDADDFQVNLSREADAITATVTAQIAVQP